MPKIKITYDDRVDIEMMLQDKISKSMISELKGISRGALYNEIEKGMTGNFELHPKTWTASIKTTPLGTGSGTPPGSVPSV